MKPNYRGCISCRKKAHRREFWRIVRQFPDKTISLDEGMGRSAYICPSEQCLKIAQKKNRLGRVLKAPVPQSVYDKLWQRLNLSP
ncbi:MAG: YlxR family protein [Cyanobacteria bacterium P01_F01_bin.150]